VTTLVPDVPRAESLDPDRPRSISPARPPVDVFFRNSVRAVGFLVLVLTGSIAVFLGFKLVPTLKLYGGRFFTSTAYSPRMPKGSGIVGALAGTAEVAIVAVVVGFPLALMTAIYISEYAPPKVRPFLVSLVDLMAAVPSIIFGLWGVLALQPQLIFVARWLSQHFSWIPIFKVHTDPNAAQWAQTQYTGSAFIAGVVVGLMIVPLACSVVCGVFVLAPVGELEGALALGSTRWGVVRTVVLPFGRGGIIGGTMLGLGRALGETIAILLIISHVDGVKINILTSGTETISSLIANDFGSVSGDQLSGLLAAGFVLFVLTIGVNTIAAVFVARSRSGEGT